MSNSSLITYKNISPFKNAPRNHKIDTITIHCIVGQWTAKQGCDFFARPSTGYAPNYVVGKDGSIGLSVDECDRSWCSSNAANDNRAITIEVASDTYDPYAVTDAAYEAVIRLCADICKRNGIKELKWQADKRLIGQVDKQNMTVHRWFANKACPGEFLYSHHYDIAKRVNQILNADSIKKDPIPANKITLTVGEEFRLKKDAIYTNGKKIPKWVINSPVYIRQIKSNNEIIFSTLKKGAITGVINIDQIDAPCEFKIRPTEVINIRSGPSILNKKTGILHKGVYTIVEEKNGWGKLKSGAGWICLKYTKKV